MSKICSSWALYRRRVLVVWVCIKTSTHKAKMFLARLNFTCTAKFGLRFSISSRSSVYFSKFQHNINSNLSRKQCGQPFSNQFKWRNPSRSNHTINSKAPPAFIVRLLMLIWIQRISLSIGTRIWEIAHRKSIVSTYHQWKISISKWLISSPSLMLKPLVH